MTSSETLSRRSISFISFAAAVDGLEDVGAFLVRPDLVGQLAPAPVIGLLDRSAKTLVICSTCVCRSVTWASVATGDTTYTSSYFRSCVSFWTKRLQFEPRRSLTRPARSSRSDISCASCLPKGLRG